MSISQPQVTLLSLDALALTTEQYGARILEPHPAATLVVLQYRFTEDATIDVDLRAPDGTWHELEVIDYTASNVGVTTYLFNTGPLRVRVTPGAQPITGYVIARYAGHAGGLA